MNSETAIILLGHGSKAPGALNSMHQVGDWLKEKYKVNDLLICQMEAPGMIISEAVEVFYNKGFTKVLVLPYFLHFGNHLREDIPAIMAEAKTKFPAVDIRLGRHLGADQALADLIQKRMLESIESWDDLVK